MIPIYFFCASQVATTHNGVKTFMKSHTINFLASTILKFIYSEKATKFCEISTNYLTGSMYAGQIIGGDFAKFCVLLRIDEV